MQPGDTIKPADQSQPEIGAASIASPTTEAPAPLPAQPAAATPSQQAVISPEQTTPRRSDDPVVSWTASEYIDHAKGPTWFAMAAVGILLLSIAVYFLLKDVVAPILLALAGTTVAVFAGRKPRVVQYAVSPSGIQVDQKIHGFSDFKSFALTESGPLPAILLTPLKRFLPPITIFYDPKEEDMIVEALADYLPYEDKEPDAVDRFMGRLRF